MPFLRSIALFAVLLAALVIGAPLQLLLARARPAAAALVPHLLCRTLLALLGVKLVCRDPPKSTSARLVVANHVSWLDVLVLARLEPLCFLAKSEVAGWPFFGPLAKVNSTVFVNRSRRRSIPGANRQMAARLVSGRSVLLFPEGTTHSGQQRGRFLTSHLACLRDMAAGGGRACIQPVAISYSDPDAAWVGNATLLPHIWTVLRCRGLTCRVAYGETHTVPAGFDRKVLGRDVAAEVETLLAGLPPPERQAEDGRRAGSGPCGVRSGVA